MSRGSDYDEVKTVDDSAALDARAAFAQQDIEASKAYHDNSRPSLEGGHEVHQHPCLGNAYVQAFTSAFVGGASLGTVAAAAGHGAGLNPTALQSVALAVALGYACMHAASTYVQRRSEQDYLWREFKRETWEWKNYPEGEKKEMVSGCRNVALTLQTTCGTGACEAATDECVVPCLQVELYESEGFTHDDAETVINLISKHEKKFIDLMMVDELQLMPPTTSEPPAVAPFAAAGFAGTAAGAFVFAQCTIAGLKEPLTDWQSALILAGLFCGAALTGACEALLRFKGASCVRVLASGSFFALCLGAAAAATYWLSKTAALDDGSS